MQRTSTMDPECLKKVKELGRYVPILEAAMDKILLERRESSGFGLQHLEKLEGLYEILVRPEQHRLSMELLSKAEALLEVFANRARDEAERERLIRGEPTPGPAPASAIADRPPVRLNLKSDSPKTSGASCSSLTSSQLLNRQTVIPKLQTRRWSPVADELMDEAVVSVSVIPTATDSKISSAATDSKISSAATDSKIPPAATDSKISPTITDSKITPTATYSKITPTTTESKTASKEELDRSAAFLESSRQKLVEAMNLEKEVQANMPQPPVIGSLRVRSRTNSRSPKLYKKSRTRSRSRSPRGDRRRSPKRSPRPRSRESRKSPLGGKRNYSPSCRGAGIHSQSPVVGRNRSPPKNILETNRSKVFSPQSDGSSRSRSSHQTRSSSYERRRPSPKRHSPVRISDTQNSPCAKSTDAITASTCVESDTFNIDPLRSVEVKKNGGRSVWNRLGEIANDEDCDGSPDDMALVSRLEEVNDDELEELMRSEPDAFPNLRHMTPQEVKEKARILLALDANDDLSNASDWSSFGGDGKERPLNDTSDDPELISKPKSPKTLSSSDVDDRHHRGTNFDPRFLSTVTCKVDNLIINKNVDQEQNITSASCSVEVAVSGRVPDEKLYLKDIDQRRSMTLKCAIEPESKNKEVGKSCHGSNSDKKNLQIALAKDNTVFSDSIPSVLENLVKRMQVAVPDEKLTIEMPSKRISKESDTSPTDRSFCSSSRISTELQKSMKTLQASILIKKIDEQSTSKISDKCKPCKENEENTTIRQEVKSISKVVDTSIRETAKSDGNVNLDKKAYAVDVKKSSISGTKKKEYVVEKCGTSKHHKSNEKESSTSHKLGINEERKTYSDRKNDQKKDKDKYKKASSRDHSAEEKGMKKTGEKEDKASLHRKSTHHERSSDRKKHDSTGKDSTTASVKNYDKHSASCSDKKDEQKRMSEKKSHSSHHQHKESTSNDSKSPKASRSDVKKPDGNKSSGSQDITKVKSRSSEEKPADKKSENIAKINAKKTHADTLLSDVKVKEKLIDSDKSPSEKKSGAPAKIVKVRSSDSSGGTRISFEDALSSVEHQKMPLKKPAKRKTDVTKVVDSASLKLTQNVSGRENLGESHVSSQKAEDDDDYALKLIEESVELAKKKSSVEDDGTSPIIEDIDMPLRLVSKRISLLELPLPPGASAAPITESPLKIDEAPAWQTNAVQRTEASLPKPTREALRLDPGGHSSTGQAAFRLGPPLPGSRHWNQSHEAPTIKPLLPELYYHPPGNNLRVPPYQRTPSQPEEQLFTRRPKAVTTYVGPGLPSEPLYHAPNVFPREPRSYAEHKELKRREAEQRRQEAEREKLRKEAEEKRLKDELEAKEKDTRLRQLAVSLADPRQRKREGAIASEKDDKPFTSPLVSLYGTVAIPKTGRGYGKQSFRIPKKTPVENKPISAHVSKQPEIVEAAKKQTKEYLVTKEPVTANKPKPAAVKIMQTEQDSVRKETNVPDVKEYVKNWKASRKTGQNTTLLTSDDKNTVVEVTRCDEQAEVAVEKTVSADPRKRSGRHSGTLRESGKDLHKKNQATKVRSHKKIPLHNSGPEADSLSKSSTIKTQFQSKVDDQSIESIEKSNLQKEKDPEKIIEPPLEPVESRKELLKPSDEHSSELKQHAKAESSANPLEVVLEPQNTVPQAPVELPSMQGQPALKEMITTLLTYLKQTDPALVAQFGYMALPNPDDSQQRKKTDEPGNASKTDTSLEKSQHAETTTSDHSLLRRDISSDTHSLDNEAVNAIGDSFQQSTAKSFDADNKIVTPSLEASEHLSGQVQCNASDAVVAAPRVRRDSDAPDLEREVVNTIADSLQKSVPNATEMGNQKSCCLVDEAMPVLSQYLPLADMSHDESTEPVEMPVLTEVTTTTQIVESIMSLESEALSAAAEETMPVLTENDLSALDKFDVTSNDVSQSSVASDSTVTDTSIREVIDKISSSEPCIDISDGDSIQGTKNMFVVTSSASQIVADVDGAINENALESNSDTKKGEQNDTLQIKSQDENVANDVGIEERAKTETKIVAKQRDFLLKEAESDSSVPDTSTKLLEPIPLTAWHEKSENEACESLKDTMDSIVVGASVAESAVGFSSDKDREVAASEVTSIVCEANPSDSSSGDLENIAGNSDSAKSEPCRETYVPVTPNLTEAEKSETLAPVSADLIQKDTRFPLPADLTQKDSIERYIEQTLQSGVGRQALVDLLKKSNVLKEILNIEAVPSESEREPDRAEDPPAVDDGDADDQDETETQSQEVSSTNIANVKKGKRVKLKKSRPKKSSSRPTRSSAKYAVESSEEEILSPRLTRQKAKLHDVSLPGSSKDDASEESDNDELSNDASLPPSPRPQTSRAKTSGSSAKESLKRDVSKKVKGTRKGKRNVSSEKPEESFEEAHSSQPELGQPLAEPKEKRKRNRTELDFLHEELRSPVFSDLMNTPGQRACRGALDAAKRGANNQRRGRSYDTEATDSEPVDDHKLRTLSISLFRLPQHHRQPPMRGRNVARRGRIGASKGRGGGSVVQRGDCLREPSPAALPSGLLLPRNLRKALRKTNGKTIPRKSLDEILKNLKPMKLVKKGSPRSKLKNVRKILKGTKITLKNGRIVTMQELRKYAFQGEDELVACLLCDVTGLKTAQASKHYKDKHGDSEVLISRLPIAAAQRALKDARRIMPIDFVDSARRRRELWACRLCGQTLPSCDEDQLFLHISEHTGEYRWQCSAPGCEATTLTRESLRSHAEWWHSAIRKKLINTEKELFPVPVEFGHVFGYLCTRCNYVQTMRRNVDYHVSTLHSQETVEIVKIDLYSRVEEKVKPTVMQPMLGKTVNEDEVVDKRATLRARATPTLPASPKKQPPKKAAKEDAQKLESEPPTEVLLSTPENQLEDHTEVPTKKRAVARKRTVTSAKISKLIKQKRHLENRLRSYHATQQRRRPPKPSVTQITLSLGPLNIKSLPNGTTLFECMVNKCIFSASTMDLFERHVENSHLKTRWDGFCQFCDIDIPSKITDRCPLSSALTHIRYHVKDGVLYAPPSEEVASPSEEVADVTGPPEEISLSIPLPEVKMEPAAIVKREQDVAEILSPDTEESLTFDIKPIPRHDAVTPVPAPSTPEAEISTPKPFLRVKTLEGDMLSTHTTSVLEQSSVVEELAPLLTVSAAPKQPSAINITTTNHPQIATKPSAPCLRNVMIKPKTPINPNPRTVLGGVLSKMSSGGTPTEDKTGSSAPVFQIVKSFSINPSHQPQSSTTPTPSEATSSKILAAFGSKSLARVVPPPSPLPEPEIVPEPLATNITINSGNTTTTIATIPLEPQTVNPVSDCGNWRNTKNPAVYSEMLIESKLADLYKCMGTMCSFTGNIAEVFLKHCELHQVAERNSTDRSWRHCAYCRQMYGPQDLANHIRKEHGASPYQCRYCFYRALDSIYVQLHQEMLHRNQPFLALNCTIPSDVDPALPPDKASQRTLVRYYDCCLCTARFKKTKDFASHMLDRHPYDMYNCHYCKNKQIRTVVDLIAHYRQHNINTYQCGYCLHGRETKIEMMYHLSSFHFNRPPHMYLRDVPERELIEEMVTPIEDYVMSDLPEGSTLAELLRVSEDETALTLQTLLPNAKFSTNPEPITEPETIPLPGSIPLGQLPLRTLPNIISKRTIARPSPNPSPSTSTTNVTSPKLIVKEGRRFVRKLRVQDGINVSIQTAIGNVAVDPFPLEAEGACGEWSLTPITLTGSNVRKSSPAQSPRCVTPVNSDELSEPPMVVRVTDFMQEATDPLVDPRAETNDTDHLEQDAMVVSSDDEDIEIIEPECNIRDEMASLRSQMQGETESLLFDNAPDSERPEQQQSRSSVITLSSSELQNTDGTPSSSVMFLSPVEAAVSSLQEQLAREAASKKQEEPLTVVEPEIDVELLSPPQKKTRLRKQVQKNRVEEEAIITRSDLYQCGSAGCDFTADTGVELKEHLVICNLDVKLTCPFCGSVTKSADSYVVHLQKHGGKRFTCSECLKKTYQSGISSHVRVFHRSSSFYLTPLDPLRKDVEADLFTFTAFGEIENPRKKGKSGPKLSKDAKKSSAPLTLEEFPDKLALPSESKRKGNKPGPKSSKEAKKLFAEPPDPLGTPEPIIKRNKPGPKSSKVAKKLFAGPPDPLGTPEPIIKRNKPGPKSSKISKNESPDPFVPPEPKTKGNKCSPKSSKVVKNFVPPPTYPAESPDSLPGSSQALREPNTYCPEDESLLPMPAIYSSEVKCGICPFFTKVRSNMVRHLRLHQEAPRRGVIVPSSAPTNPVPCLDGAGKMFDKMTNLAASSLLDRVHVESLTPAEKARLPPAVADVQRYQCGDCRHITLDEKMLHHHITALHSELDTYNCPHCPVTLPDSVRIVPLEELAHHLKHHDTKLYKCAHCEFFHFLKQAVEKHLADSHPERRQFVHIVREPATEPEMTKVYKCIYCTCTCLSSTEILSHLRKVHDIKGKFKCKECAYVGKTIGLFHPHYAKCHGGRKVRWERCYNSVQQRIATETESSAVVEPMKVSSDTTPLWQRDMGGPRTIRGIPIDSEEEVARKDRQHSGEPQYHCLLCPFTTPMETTFRQHLFNELNYVRFACKLCTCKFFSQDDATKHSMASHPGQESIVPADPKTEIDSWVDACIVRQTMEMTGQLPTKKAKTRKSDGSEPTKRKKPECSVLEGTRSRPSGVRIESSAPEILQNRSGSSKTPELASQRENVDPEGVECPVNEPVEKSGRLAIECPHCHETHRTIMAIKTHITCEHLRMGRFECRHCPRTFLTENLAKRHALGVHQEQSATPAQNSRFSWFALPDKFWEAEYGISNQNATTCVKTDHGAAAVECELCRWRGAAAGMSAHMATVHRLRNGRWWCEVPGCGYNVPSESRLLKHDETHSWKMAGNGEHTPTFVYDLSFLCGLCPTPTSRYFTELEAIGHSMEKHGLNGDSSWDLVKPTTFLCGYCLISTNGREHATDHWVEAHKAMNLAFVLTVKAVIRHNILVYCCPICSFRNTSLQSCEEHIMIHAQRFICGNCPAVFTTLKHLEDHRTVVGHKLPMSTEEWPLSRLRKTILVDKGGKLVSPNFTRPLSSPRRTAPPTVADFAGTTTSPSTSQSTETAASELTQAVKRAAPDTEQSSRKRKQQLMPTHLDDDDDIMIL